MHLGETVINSGRYVRIKFSAVIHPDRQMQRASIKEKMERPASVKTERVWMVYTLFLLLLLMMMMKIVTMIMTVFTGRLSVYKRLRP
jgi:hypothetical protein